MSSRWAKARFQNLSNEPRDTSARGGCRPSKSSLQIRIDGDGHQLLRRGHTGYLPIYPGTGKKHLAPDSATRLPPLELSRAAARVRRIEQYRRDPDSTHAHHGVTPSYKSSGRYPHARKIVASSASLIAFLKRAPERPFTRRSHSAQVAWRIGLPSTTLKYA